MAGQGAVRDLAWDDVRLFLALCRSPTVGRAARTLGVDTSTASRRLAVLENTLKARLFDRGREGVAMTKAAEDLLPVAEEIEQTMRRFTNTAEGLEREVSGLVRVTCPPDVAEIVVVPLLAELLSRHPNLRIELEAGESIVDLTRREADLALRTVRPSGGDLLVMRLLSVRWVVAAQPALVRKLGTLRAWPDAPWIGWSEHFSHLPPARWVNKHLRGGAPVVRSQSLRVQLAAAAAGVGVVLVPEPSVQHFGLVPVKFAPALRETAREWPSDDLFLVTHRALRDVPRLRAVWDLLKARWARTD